MYAAVRQGKAKAEMAEELAVRIKEGAIPIISDVPGFRAYYVVYAPDDTVTAISIFDSYAGAEESNRRALAWIETSLAPLLTGTATAVAGPVHRAHSGLTLNRWVDDTAGDHRTTARGADTGQEEHAEDNLISGRGIVISVALARLCRVPSARLFGCCFRCAPEVCFCTGGLKAGGAWRAAFASTMCKSVAVPMSSTCPRYSVITAMQSDMRTSSIVAIAD
jgi:hypothetical protein